MTLWKCLDRRNIFIFSEKIVSLLQLLLPIQMMRLYMFLNCIQTEMEEVFSFIPTWHPEKYPEK